MKDRRLDIEFTDIISEEMERMNSALTIVQIIDMRKAVAKALQNMTVEYEAEYALDREVADKSDKVRIEKHCEETVKSCIGEQLRKDERISVEKTTDGYRSNYIFSARVWLIK